MTPKLRETTWPDIDSALAALAPDRAERRDDWLAVGMALHAYDSGEESFARWDAWSRQSDKYDARAIRSSWNGFKPGGGKTIATLFGFAKADGWKPAGEHAAEQHENGARNGATQPHGSPASRETVSTAGKEAGKAGKRQRRQVWGDEATAVAKFDELPRVIEHDDALEFLGRDYGLVVTDIEGLDWRVGEYPGLGAGIVYHGVSPTGQRSFKFKSFERNAKGKRDIRFFYAPEEPSGGPAFHVKREGVVMVIVAGEEKAALAAGCGYAVLGMMVGEGEQTVGEAWAQWIQKAAAPEIILANDHDEGGKKANEAAAAAISKAGYPRLQIRQIKWPEEFPEGYDLNDAVKYGQDPGDVIAGAEYLHARLTIMDIAEILEAKIPTNDNLLGAYMLFRGGPRYSLMIGPPAIGKSRLAMQMALDVTGGFDFCGLESHGSGTKWLFLQAENMLRRLQSDLRMMLRGSSDKTKNDVLRRIKFLAPTTELDMFLKFGMPGVEERLGDAIRLHDPDVIVWDPLIEFFGGESENANVEMKDCVSRMMKISRAARRDTAVLILAHASPGKASTAKAYGFDAGHFHRGATSLIGAAGASFNVALADEDDDDLLIMACGKCSDGPRFEPRGLRLDRSRMRYDVDPSFSLETWKEATRGNGRGLENKKFKPEMVLAAISDGRPVAQAELIGRLVSAHDVSRTAIQNGLRKMANDGQIDTERGVNERGKTVWISLPK